MSERAERPLGFRIGEAVAFRIDQGRAQQLTWPECVEAVEHPTAGLKRTELVETIAYLGAQLVGARNSVDADAALAMGQIRFIVTRYAETHDGGVA